jgi:hypothetical protein
MPDFPKARGRRSFVGGADTLVIDLNQKAFDALHEPKALKIVSRSNAPFRRT